MSNAMRLGKRTLAGVAAGALALGALSIAGATSASAKPNVKPTASKTATVNAVRSSGSGASAISLPAATLTWSGAKTISSTATVDLLTAPSAGAKLYYNADDTVTLNTDDSINGQSLAVTTYSVDDSQFNFRVDTAGAYTGQIYNGTDTVSFSFTTAGAPTSLVVAPATQTVLVGGQADFSAVLKDASGNPTQPQTVDTVSLTRSPTDDTLVQIDDTVASYNVVTGLVGTNNVAGAYNNLATGTAYFSLNTNPASAGTTTITATPLGTLPGTGVTAQTATVTKSGTVSATAVANISVTSPATAYNSWDVTAGTSWSGRSAQVPEGTTSLTITVDDTTSATAGGKVRISVGTSQGTVNGSTSTQYFDLVTDANKQAKQDITLGGLAVTNGTIVTVNQVTVADAQVKFGANNVTLPISVLTPQVAAYTTTVSPTSLVAKIGTVTPVTVTVDDSFGTAQPNYTVQVYRGSTVSGGTFLGQATTNASGVATVNVTSASTVTVQTTESYSYKIIAPGGSSFNKEAGTSITYTTTGNITTLSVTPGSGTACSNTSCTVTAYGAVRVASAGVISATGSTATQAVSTGVVTAGNGSNMIALTIATTPSNASTVTVPEGLKVSKTAPDGVTDLWSGGGQTATVGATAYIWATKTGTHDVVVESGGLKVTVKIHVYNTGADAYNIVLSPAKQDLKVGAFGTAELKVTDAFGNVVDTTDDSGAVAMSVTGQVLFGGYTNAIASATTGAAGTYTATLIAGNDPGAAVITAVPKTGNGATAWQTGYVKPTGFAAPVTSTTAAVTVIGGSATKTITITDSGRTTVSGKPGVYANGTTTGFATGDTLKVWVKFPGQTEYTEGSAKPALDSGGAFEWSRKTGKKTYVYFSNDDGLVKSSSVIIPAK